MNFTNKFPMVQIGQIVRRNQTPIELEDDVTYKQITVRTKGGGACLRGIKLGKEINTKKQYIVTQGQFIMSKIDARNGAFGVISKDLDGAIVTADFPVFDVNLDLVIPEFLFLLSSTEAFAKFAQSCSRGTTNRQRIDVNLFLSQRIPLPTLEQQRFITQAYDKKIHQANLLEDQAIESEKSIVSYLKKELNIKHFDISHDLDEGLLHTVHYKNLTNWSINKIFSKTNFKFYSTTYPSVPIKKVILSIEGGKTPNTSISDYWNGDYYWVSAKDMKELFLKHISDTITKKAIEECGLKVYPDGTIISVFRSGILRHSFPISISTTPVTINQDLKAISVDESTVSKLYFVFYLSIMKDIVLNSSRKKGATVESINLETFYMIPIIVPPTRIQDAIVNHIKSQKTLIETFSFQAEALRKIAIEEFEITIFE